MSEALKVEAWKWSDLRAVLAGFYFEAVVIVFKIQINVSSLPFPFKAVENVFVDQEWVTIVLSPLIWRTSGLANRTFGQCLE